MRNKYRCLGAILVAMATSLQAQTLQGRIDLQEQAGKVIRLMQTRGADAVPFDSTRIARDGAFRFSRPVNATGFYQLALNDTDLVNIVMDRREPLVDLRFTGLPLEDHIEVITSEENKRLLELRYVMGETGAIQEAVRQQKALLSYTDTLQLEALDRLERNALNTQEEYLQELAADSAISYFARNFVANRILGTARGKGPMGVAKVFDFSDPELMRSTTYDGAVMMFFQNLNPVSEGQFIVASDTLMDLAGHNPETGVYMLEHLIDLFSTYGPEMALQHVIDRYVAPAGTEADLPPRLLAKVRDVLTVAVGRTAPDVELNDHGTGHMLSELAKANRYTVVFFYSSTCDHCHAQLPGLKADHERFKAQGFDVIGIALDADSAEFKENIRLNAIPWKCYSEFNGWGSVPANVFRVKATPSFYLLDDRMKILAKPRDARELAEVLEHLYSTNGGK